jgi:hypothetical protein
MVELLESNFAKGKKDSSTTPRAAAQNDEE